MVINIFHLGEKIIDVLGDGSDYGLKISYSIETELLGTGGGIANAIHLFKEPFIVLSGDIWTDFDFPLKPAIMSLPTCRALIVLPFTKPRVFTIVLSAISNVLVINMIISPHLCIYRSYTED